MNLKKLTNEELQKVLNDVVKDSKRALRSENFDYISDTQAFEERIREEMRKRKLS